MVVCTLIPNERRISTSPLKTLSRGYSIITLNGKTIKEAKYLKKDDEINIKLFDGQVNAKILKKECEEE